MNNDRQKFLAGIIKEGYDSNLPTGFKEDDDSLIIELEGFDINDDSITIYSTNFKPTEVLFEDFFDFMKKDNKLNKVLYDYLVKNSNDLEIKDKTKDEDPFDNQDR